MKELLDYHIAETDKKFEKLFDKLDKLHTKLDDLNQFKWKITGIALVVSITFPVIVPLISSWVRLDKR